MASATLSVSANAPPGYKFTTLVNPNISDTPSVACGQSPTVVTSDMVIFRKFVTKDGVTTTHSVSISTNGMPTIYAASDSASMSFLFFFWDESTSAYGTTAVYSVAALDQSSSASIFGNNIWQWLAQQGSAGGAGATIERALQYLAANGFTGPINEALYAWLGSFSYSGALTTRINQFERAYTHRYS